MKRSLKLAELVSMMFGIFWPAIVCGLVAAPIVMVLTMQGRGDDTRFALILAATLSLIGEWCWLYLQRPYMDAGDRDYVWRTSRGAVQAVVGVVIFLLMQIVCAQMPLRLAIACTVCSIGFGGFFLLMSTLFVVMPGKMGKPVLYGAAFGKAALILATDEDYFLRIKIAERFRLAHAGSNELSRHFKPLPDVYALFVLDEALKDDYLREIEFGCLGTRAQLEEFKASCTIVETSMRVPMPQDFAKGCARPISTYSFWKLVHGANAPVPTTI